MKIAGLDFPDSLITAILDGKLVIFAGAGVSMGEPANLPNFIDLARQIAGENSKSKKGLNNTDEFLGRLKDNGINVHLLAAKLLQQNNPKPTELHRNILQLYSKEEDIRIVTTNYDLLFEEAFKDIFTTPLKVFECPTLPLGEKFHGIVHIHGSINEPEDMVLTDQDFGRAYMTGSTRWASQFLVDLFRSYIVLFIGYSHRDKIMTYLARSLSKETNKKRYVLTGNKEKDTDRWYTLGIRPIEFMQSHKKNYDELYKVIKNLANHMQRDMPAWQREITRIAQKPPPNDEESAEIIEYAFINPKTTRLFTATAKPSDWAEWVFERQHLDELNTDEDHMKIVNQLKPWLAQHPRHLTKSLQEFLARRTERNEILAEWIIKMDHGSGLEKLADEQANEVRGDKHWLGMFWQELKCKIVALFRS